MYVPPFCNRDEKDGKLIIKGSNCLYEINEKVKEVQVECVYCNISIYTNIDKLIIKGSRNNVWFSFGTNTNYLGCFGDQNHIYLRYLKVVLKEKGILRKRYHLEEFHPKIEINGNDNIIVVERADIVVNGKKKVLEHYTLDEILEHLKERYKISVKVR